MALTVLFVFVPVRQRVKEKIARDREERAQKVIFIFYSLLQFFLIEFITTISVLTWMFFFLFSSEAVDHRAQPQRPNLPSPAPRRPPATALHPLRRSMMSPGYRYRLQSHAKAKKNTHWGYFTSFVFGHKPVDQNFTMNVPSPVIYFNETIILHEMTKRIVSSLLLFLLLLLILTVKVRLLDGSTISTVFKAQEPLAAVRVYVQMNSNVPEGQDFTLLSLYPRHVYTELDMEKPLKELGECWSGRNIRIWSTLL